MTIQAYVPLFVVSRQTLGQFLVGCGTYNVRAGVVEKLPPEPMLAAAITCTAQPQSIDATEAIEPIVFASGAI